MESILLRMSANLDNSSFSLLYLPLKNNTLVVWHATSKLTNGKLLPTSAPRDVVTKDERHQVNPSSLICPKKGRCYENLSNLR